MENYEERYKKALGRAVAKIDTFNHLGNVSVAKSIEEIFPELAESEDEKIRKELLSLFEDGRDGLSHRYTGSDCERYIAWLEKQKERKTAIEAWKEMRFEVYAQASGNRHEPNCSDDNTKMFSLNDIDEIFEKVSDSVVVQKPSEWSEEDKRALNDAIVTLSMYANGEIPHILPSILLEDVERLKSLRPQPHWKPSEEQMEALWYIIPNLPNCEEDVDKITILSTLYEELKTLRDYE